MDLSDFYLVVCESKSKVHINDNKGKPMCGTKSLIHELAQTKSVPFNSLCKACYLQSTGQDLDDIRLEIRDEIRREYGWKLAQAKQIAR